MNGSSVEANWLDPEHTLTNHFNRSEITGVLNCIGAINQEPTQCCGCKRITCHGMVTYLPLRIQHMSADGKAGGGNSKIGRDAYGFALSYYNNDYKSISTSTKSFANAAAAGFGFKALYNGNIAAMGVNVPKIGEPLLYTYTYDQLNRITKLFTYNGLNLNTNSWNISALQDYREQVSYDANGNIKTYKRNGDAARSNASNSGMDNLTYSYKPGTNQLDKVVDAARDAAAGEYDKYNDIRKGQTDGNHVYDGIGNLIRDQSEGITNIEWTVYGKTSSITKNGGINISSIL